MSVELLGHINSRLTALGINYEFGEWSSPTVPDPYFVGEYSEEASLTKLEDGMQESTFIVTGFGTSWLTLEQKKATIENNMNETAILSNGNGIAISYDSAMIVPTGDAELKRIQINLNIKEWSVNLNV